MKAKIILPSTLEELAVSLRETGLPSKAYKQLVKQIRPAMALRATLMQERQLPIGCSKIGGQPDLPITMKWPMRKPYEDSKKLAEQYRHKAFQILADSKKPNCWLTPEQGKIFSEISLNRAKAVSAKFPLSFVLQLDLKSLSKKRGFDSALPHEGRLLFFYDSFTDPGGFSPSARNNFRLIWDKEKLTNLERRSAPAALAVIDKDLPLANLKPAKLEPHLVFTPISIYEKDWSAFDLKNDELLDSYQEWFDIWERPDSPKRVNHQLGGWGIPLQSGLQARSQLAFHGIDCGSPEGFETPKAKKLLAHANDWRLLIQIGRDDALGFRIGCVYVMMREQDIEKRSFENAWVVYQCD